jgi:hypothetical protein
MPLPETTRGLLGAKGHAKFCVSIILVSDSSDNVVV